MQKVRIKNAPEPKGHYSPAVVHNGLIFVSGQLPMNHATGAVETGAIELQTELALEMSKRFCWKQTAIWITFCR